jgi:hypothetical protein
MSAATSGDPLLDQSLLVLVGVVSARTFNCLHKKNEIHTLRQLTGWTEQQLMRTPGFGRKALQEVKDTLADYGLALAEEGRAQATLSFPSVHARLTRIEQRLRDLEQRLDG